MGWYNLSNKKFNVEKLESENISSNYGKPNKGLWFSISYDNIDSSCICEWHNYLNYSCAPTFIKNNYINKNNKTYVNKVEFSKELKFIKLSDIKDLFLNKKNKKDIFKKLNIYKEKHLLLVLSSKKDYKILKKFDNYFDKGKSEYSLLWNYIATNFSGCMFDQDFFRENDRNENEFVNSLDTSSLIVFSEKGFKFKTHEMKLEFGPLKDLENQSRSMI